MSQERGLLLLAGWEVKYGADCCACCCCGSKHRSYRRAWFGKKWSSVMKQTNFCLVLQVYKTQDLIVFGARTRMAPPWQWTWKGLLIFVDNDMCYCVLCVHFFSARQYYFSSELVGGSFLCFESTPNLHLFWTMASTSAPPPWLDRKPLTGQ